MATVMPSEIDDLLRLLRVVGLPEARLNLLSHKVSLLVTGSRIYLHWSWIRAGSDWVIEF